MQQQIEQTGMQNMIQNFKNACACNKWLYSFQAYHVRHIGPKIFNIGDLTITCWQCDEQKQGAKGDDDQIVNKIVQDCKGIKCLEFGLIGTLVLHSTEKAHCIQKDM
eukprot:4771_1